MVTGKSSFPESQMAVCALVPHIVEGARLLPGVPFLIATMKAPLLRPKHLPQYYTGHQTLTYKFGADTNRVPVTDR